MVGMAHRFALALLMFALVSGVGAQTRLPQQTPIVVKVLVLNYDPLIQYDPSVPNNPILPSEHNRRLHSVCGWTDPHVLAAGYEADVEASARGSVDYQVVEWRDLDEWPKKTDSFRYTDLSFMVAWRQTRTFHSPDGLDYPFAMSSQGVEPLINAGTVDEVWLFGAPYFGYWESAMAGPGAFFINGGVYPTVPTNRPFAIMGFNYERGIAEMLHDLSHRTESTMRRVFGSWNPAPFQHDWDRFSAVDITSPGQAGCGNCHYPPNATSDYDYANPRIVISSAEDWLNYPNLTGATTLVGRETWGGPDYHRNYLKWWFARLPNAPGLRADWRQHNWWKYVFDFPAYDQSGYALASILRGQVVLEGYSGPTDGIEVRVEFRTPNTATVREVRTTTLDATGRFDLYTALSGSFDVRVKGSKWLQKKLGSISVSRTPGAHRVFVLRAGDIVPDNVVNLDDFLVLAGSYEAADGDPNYDAAADLDGDARVDLSDFLMLAANYDAVGD